MSVGRICCRDVDTVEIDENVMAAAVRMRERDVGTLVCVDGQGRPVGVVTDRDLAMRVVAEGRAPSDTPIGHAMTPEPHTVNEDTPIETALSLMRSARCRRLPVVGKDQRLVGIVALDDVLALLAEEFALLGGLIEREAPHKLRSA